MTMKTHKASCHCGAVKVEAEIDLAAGTARCNCSICAKSRWWGISTDPKSLRVVQGEDHTFPYSFGSRSIQMHHCKTCGLRVYGKGYVEQIGGDFAAVNVACLDDVSDEERAAIPITYCNGRDNDWQHEPKINSYL
jgi:hypothetical protein